MHTCRAPVVGVFAGDSIPAGARLGPVPGHFRLGKSASDRKETGPQKKVRLVRGELVDESGSAVSDWILLIRSARNSEEQNLEAVSDLPGGQIFYRVLREIRAGEELSAWYSESLARWFHMPTTATPTHDERGEERYICWYCWRIFRYPNTLKAHVHFHCALTTAAPVGQDHALRGPGHTLSRSPKSGDTPSGVSTSPFAHKAASPRRRGREHQDRALDMSVTSSLRLRPCPLQPGMQSAFAPAGLVKAFSLPQEVANGDGKADALAFSKLSCPSRGGRPGVDPVAPPPRGFSLLSHLEETSAFRHVSPARRCPQVPPAFPPERFSLPPPYPGERGGVPVVPFTVYNGELLYASPYYPLKLHLLRYPDSAPPYLGGPGPGADGAEAPADGTRLEPAPPPPTAAGRPKRGHLCLYCGKLYSRKYGLKIHMRTHTGYKPLKCKVCSRPFGDPSNLNKHVRLHAEGNTPYRCQHCGKVLVRRRDLERHVKSRHPAGGQQAAAPRDPPAGQRSEEDSDVDVCLTDEHSDHELQASY